MVNKPLIRPYFLGGVALGGVARIPLIKGRFLLFFLSGDVEGYTPVSPLLKWG